MSVNQIIFKQHHYNIITFSLLIYNCSSLRQIGSVLSCHSGANKINYCIILNEKVELLHRCSQYRDPKPWHVRQSCPALVLTAGMENVSHG